MDDLLIDAIAAWRSVYSSGIVATAITGTLLSP